MAQLSEGSGPGLDKKAVRKKNIGSKEAGNTSTVLACRILPWILALFFQIDCKL